MKIFAMVLASAWAFGAKNPKVELLTASSAAPESSELYCILDSKCEGKWIPLSDDKKKGISLQFLQTAYLSSIAVEGHGLMDTQIQLKVNGQQWVVKRFDKSEDGTFVATMTPKSRETGFMEISQFEVKSVSLSLLGEVDGDITGIRFLRAIRQGKEIKNHTLVIDPPVRSKN